YNSLFCASGDRDMNRHLLDRRQFNALCAAIGLSFPAAGTMIGALSGTSVLAADTPPRTARLRNSTIVPAIGQDLDLYLLHWPVPRAQFSSVVAAFEQLRAGGKIRAWGVSNFDISQMEDLFRVPDGHGCATNQVPYSLNNRGIERDLLTWCKEHGMPVMA